MKKVIVMVIALLIICGVMAVGFQVLTKYQDHAKKVVEKRNETENKAYELLATQFIEGLKQDIEMKGLYGETKNLNKIRNDYEWTLDMKGNLPDCMDLIQVEGYFSGALFFDDKQITLVDSKVIKVVDKNQETYQACLNMS
ncbi:MAG TPA: hypothetical protein IAD49_06380 [Candidatus Fimihabitans intestinipullorum]|uniref:Uncharacterized protein n=1 Tax=Candidatus Fimihabitans intestinipullorum TaxID=2840820 RepID=A0A9D1HXQ8_9BACT|nr:hypothetical protein [Candidatus Fimihabitans intestinipullorum]